MKRTFAKLLEGRKLNRQPEMCDNFVIKSSSCFSSGGGSSIDSGSEELLTTTSSNAVRNDTIFAAVWGSMSKLILHLFEKKNKHKDKGTQANC